MEMIASLRAAGRRRLTLWNIYVALALIVSPQVETQAAQIRLLAFGDSLSAGYGLAAGDGFTGQLEAALRDAGLDVEVVNGGVSGDTTAGGLARLDWMLSDRPDAVIVELGANDGMRGFDPVDIQANLDAILNILAGKNIPVLLAGMLAPPNLGREYGAAYKGLFIRLADDYRVVFYPFFLAGVAGDRALNQADAIHPNKAGVAEIIRRILPSVKMLLARIKN